jgi:hypothetical protein
MGAPNAMNFGQPIVVGTLTADPGTAVNGQMYYNSTSGQFRQYAGSTWSNVGSAALSTQNILVGNGSNVATAVATSSVGNILADSTNGLTIKASAIVDSMVSATAAIQLSKLAALGNNFVLQSNGSGVISASSVTSTTLGYLDATSSIQTQLNGKLALAGGTMSGNIAMGSNSITGLANPVNPGDAVNYSTLQALTNGISWKNAVLVATTANITLSGEQTIDGFTTSASRVLVKNQTLSANNGIYLSGSGAWTRTSDANAWSQLPASAVFVQEGTVNGDLGFVCNVAPGGTLGTTSVTFAQFSSAGAYTADGVTLQLVSGVFSVKNGGIADTQVSATAAIQLSKLAALGNNFALVSNGSGVISASSVTAATLAFLDATSSVQTQLNAKANTTLGNLGTTAINASLNPATDISISAGTTSLRYINVATQNVLSGASDLTLNANSGSNNVQLINSGFKRGASSSRFVNQIYVDSIALSGSATATVLATFTVAYATINAQEITYTIKDGTTNATRIGTIRVSTDGTNVSLTDMYSETADAGTSWSASISGSNMQIAYTTNANAKTMRADVKQFLT